MTNQLLKILIGPLIAHQVKCIYIHSLDFLGAWLEAAMQLL